MGFADEIVPEPLGGAHTDAKGMAETLKQHILRNLREVLALSEEQRQQGRYAKFRAMGRFAEGAPPALAKPKRTKAKSAADTLADETTADKKD